MEEATRSMPGGSTRNYGYYSPYPAVFDRGAGAYLWDLDGNRYVDLVSNGFSLAHGHGYGPVVAALTAALARGMAWPGASEDQIKYAAYLCERLSGVDLVRFTNSGTEAAMLAVKVARRYTGRPLIVKARAAYHGSYDDLEAGLHGNPEFPGRTAVADFGDLESFERVLADHAGDVAAVITEPALISGAVVPPPPGFLEGLQELARSAGALFIIDDCLMLRLAPGGSAERYGLSPDLTVLGKFIGGGTPMGALGGRREVMSVFDRNRPDTLHHGGSFNGNLLSSVAGYASLEALTAAAIDDMEHRLDRLRAACREAADELGLPFVASSAGSIMGVYLTSAPIGPGPDPMDVRERQQFQLSCMTHGVLVGTQGQIGLSTAVDDVALKLAADGIAGALRDFAHWRESRVTASV
jgi:glutamate-1-semialdehyde 2,1-aminomutase